MTIRKTALGEQAKADVAATRAAAMTNDLLGRYLQNIAENIRYVTPAERVAIMREAARRLVNGH